MHGTVRTIMYAHGSNMFVCSHTKAFCILEGLESRARHRHPGNDGRPKQKTSDNVSHPRNKRLVCIQVSEHSSAAADGRHRKYTSAKLSVYGSHSIACGTVGPLCTELKTIIFSGAAMCLRGGMATI